MTKADVITLQTGINGLGYKPALVVDGIAGKLTRSGVLWFQQAYGVKPVDGIAGPITNLALKAAVAGDLKPLPVPIVAPGYFGCVYGLGGSMLDPAGGMATLETKGGVLPGMTTAAQPWDQNNVQGLADHIKALPASTQIFLTGDSCGANKLPWVAAAISPLKVSGMWPIQASVFCNAGCPPIGSNVQEATVVFSDYIHTGGLGVFCAPLEVPPVVAAGETIDDGKVRVGNNGHTKIRYVYIPAAHPDDQDPVVQDMVIAGIKRIRANG